jgi:hypothetical protein
MYYVQIWENEREMAIQKYLYSITEYVVMVAFVLLFSVILHEFNIY